jgi:hypothetical protein
MPSRNRGMPKRKLRDLSRQTPTPQELDALIDEMGRTIGNAPPVVTAIFGLAMLDHELESRIRMRLKRKDEETWSKLTDQGGPLSSFYSKMMLGYALGLYDDVFRHNLDICRQIRNAFAHAKKLITFDHELIVDAIKAVKLPAGKRSQYYQSLASVKSMKGGCQNSYAGLCLVLSTELIRKDTVRLKASSRRWKRKVGTSLLAALMASQSRGQQAGVPGGGFLGGGLLGGPAQAGSAHGPGESQGVQGRGIAGLFALSNEDKDK